MLREMSVEFLERISETSHDIVLKLHPVYDNGGHTLFAGKASSYSFPNDLARSVLHLYSFMDYNDIGFSLEPGHREWRISNESPMTLCLHN